MKTIALYPGSFNPFHHGHANILLKAKEIFGWENVILCQGINPDKNNELIKPLIEVQAFAQIKQEVRQYDCFLHELVDEYEVKGYNVVIIRGLRNEHDFAAEQNQMAWINELRRRESGKATPINVVYIPCDRDLDHISSSGIRSLEKFRKGAGKKYMV